MTDREKREKVIRGLEYCLKRGQDKKVLCGDCPYWIDDFESGCHVYEMMRDALALLKEQGARVMTREEAREALHNADFIVIEERDNVDILLGIRTLTSFDISNGSYLEFDDMDDDAKSGDYYVCNYYNDFRFWTARPTEEQRKAVKWHV